MHITSFFFLNFLYLFSVFACLCLSPSLSLFLSLSPPLPVSPSLCLLLFFCPSSLFLSACFCVSALFACLCFSPLWPGHETAFYEEAYNGRLLVSTKEVHLVVGSLALYTQTNILQRGAGCHRPTSILGQAIELQQICRSSTVGLGTMQLCLNFTTSARRSEDFNHWFPAERGASILMTYAIMSVSESLIAGLDVL